MRFIRKVDGENPERISQDLAEKIMGNMDPFKMAEVFKMVRSGELDYFIYTTSNITVTVRPEIVENKLVH